MKAKSKPLATKTPADYGVDTARRLETLKVTEPAKRQDHQLAAIDPAVSSGELLRRKLGHRIDRSFGDIAVAHG